MDLNRRRIAALLGAGAAIALAPFALREGVRQISRLRAPVRVGVLHSLTGTMALSERSVVDALMLAIDEVNDAGGVLGRRVEPIVVDGESNWPVFAREAERLIQKERVCTVFGCWTSA